MNRLTDFANRREAQRPALVADTGGAVHGMTIDLWFPTLAEALAWGRRTVTITLH